MVMVYALIYGGAALLLFSLYPAIKLIRELPSGRAKLSWLALSGLIVFFFFGYIGYSLFFAGDDLTHAGLLVPSIFFFGACFVLAVNWLSLRTVHDVKRLVVLEKENITDPLMGIFNRRHLDDRVIHEVARARRYDLPLSLLILDLDHFKQVNDTYGHQTGDAVLKQLGELVVQTVRISDVPARYGGEEIVVITPGTGLEGAEILATRLREKIESSTFVPEQKDREHLRCTVSIGVATLKEGIEDGPGLVGAADKALYRAKEEGRNRVVCA